VSYAPTVTYGIGTVGVRWWDNKPTALALTPGVKYYINVAGRSGAANTCVSGRLDPARSASRSASRAALTASRHQHSSPVSAGARLPEGGRFVRCAQLLDSGCLPMAPASDSRNFQ